jgi:hypothetical protein
METKPGGLELREREEFILRIPPDFPFDRPTLFVTDPERFAGFSHVIWSSWICLYQGEADWDPADGLFGFFDRLALWLGKAAIDDMDPPGGPVEPPHGVRDRSQPPFVIRCNAPVEPGERWYGLAELEEHANRTELVGWKNSLTDWPKGRSAALAIFLPGPLPIELPERGSDFFRELFKQGFNREKILATLAVASIFSRKGQPVNVVLGLPMRRTMEGKPRVHVAIWSTDAKLSDYIWDALPDANGTPELRALTQDFADKLYSVLEETQVSWCRVMEARDEIVVRRDKQSPIAWFTGKKILVLGCGALGGWAAEIIARAAPDLIHVVDHSEVGPGLLTRQNYRQDDIGRSKSDALAGRLREITAGTDIQAFCEEAHHFITENPERLSGYDLILDCTASTKLQMKLERDWGTLQGATPHIISLAIDSTAQRSLGVIISPGSSGGPWDAYMRLKYRLCLDSENEDLVSAFYPAEPLKNLLRPEPGCSEPTFVGSTADVAGLVSTGLNLGVAQLASSSPQIGFAFSGHRPDGRAGALTVHGLPEVHLAKTGVYLVRIEEKVFRESRAWVRNNSRIRSSNHETGGLLWGLWDDATGVIWVFDASGPPSDSRHDPGHFICGTQGTVEEHHSRMERSHGTCGFLGYWHTHPDMPADQSGVDLTGMTALVAGIGQNRRRAMMLIYGRTGGCPAAGIYVYESISVDRPNELISVGITQIQLDAPIV